MAIRIHREDDEEPAGSHRGSDQGTTNAAAPGWDLSRERPTRRADVDRDRMVFKCSLPFGIRWLFRLERTFRRRDETAERTFRLLLALVLLTVLVFAAVVSVMALSA